MTKFCTDTPFGPNVFIAPGSIIGDNVNIGPGAIIYPNVSIMDNTHIGPYSIIGEPKVNYYKDSSSYSFSETVIGFKSIIRSHSVIYEGVTAGTNLQTGHRVTIREGSLIGHNCGIGTLCDIQGNVRIGNFVRLHSNVHVGQLSTIEDFVWIYPYVVLTNDPYPPMGRLRGVTIREYAQVATGSVIMPGVVVGRDALIGAHTLVRKDVPDECVVVGVPGEVLCSIRDIRDDSGRPVYPWRDYLEDDRGYPWQQPSIDEGEK